MTARQFFAFSYVQMAELAGGPAELEETLEKWRVDADFAELTQTHSTDWDTADRLAKSLLAGN